MASQVGASVPLKITTVEATKSWLASTGVSMVGAHVHRADPIVMARLGKTQVHHRLTVPTCVAEAAMALIVVGQLHTVKASWGVARSRQALVDVALAVLPGKSRWACARVAADAVHALTIIQAAWAFI